MVGTTIEPAAYTAVGSNTTLIDIGFDLQNFSPDCLVFAIPENASDVILRDYLSKEIITTFIVLYTLIIVLACFGNGLVIVIIARNRKNRTVTDCFLLSLAIGDLLIALVNMPFQLYYHIHNRWELGQEMCKFVNYIQAITITASIATLTAISLDRYVAICHPFRSRQSKSQLKAILMLVSIWNFSFLISIPQAFFSKINPPKIYISPTDGCMSLAYVCQEHWNSRTEFLIYNIFWYCVIYVTPTIIMMGSYTAVGHRLWIRKPIGDMLENPRNYDRHIKQKKQIVKMLFIIVAMFTICWFPFFTVHFYGSFNETGDDFQITRAILQLVGYSNCCINPVVYTFLNKNFQNQFQYLLSCCSWRRKPLKPEAIAATTMIHNTNSTAMEA
ncbi:QRFP-like peptide receptor [Lineus longissimus]|uniref:QRFP-like peptide receptor n=1 Tax=Lineus longissimus TaxID=88925 RepID=UPI002B4E4125